MSTIYLTEAGMEVTKDGGSIVFTNIDGKRTELPSNYVTALVVMSKVQISHNVMLELLRNDGKVIYLDKYGKVLGKVTNNEGSGRALVNQVEAYRDEAKRLSLAKYIVAKKIDGEIKLLEYINKRIKSEEISKAFKKLKLFKNLVDKQKDEEQLMGIEGMCARIYFGCFSLLIKNNAFSWQGRKKHPAPDPVNALLSYTYALVEKDIRIALADTDLALSVGYLHSLDNRKDSLVYDLLEIFRASVADKFVLRFINLQMAHSEDFVQENGRCFMSKELLKKFIAAYEDYAGDFNKEDCAREMINREVSDFKKMICKNE